MFKYGGLVRVICIEALMYALYGVIGYFVRYGPLLQICKEMNICTKVTGLSIDNSTVTETVTTVFYHHSFDRFELHFVLGWPVVILALYAIVISLYYKFGHPKKLIINTRHQDLSEPKDSKESPGFILKEEGERGDDA